MTGCSGQSGIINFLRGDSDIVVMIFKFNSQLLEVHTEIVVYKFEILHSKIFYERHFLKSLEKCKFQQQI